MEREREVGGWGVGGRGGGDNDLPLHPPQSTPTSHSCCAGGKIQLLDFPTRVFQCATPAEVRSELPEGVDVLAFQCRNPIHKAHYELFIRALEAPNVSKEAVCLVHPTCGPTQVRFTRNTRL